MIELKTLKDFTSKEEIRDFWFSIGIGRTKKNSINLGDVKETCGLFSNVLKDEAIKWVKFYEERRKHFEKETGDKYCHSCIIFHRLSQEFMRFFNITEEDLK